MAFEIDTNESVKFIVLAIFLIFASGIFFGLTYFLMEKVETSFQNLDCEIQGNVFVDDCQELFAIAFYPLLALRSILVWGSYMFIFGLIIAMLMLGYNSGKTPALLGVLLIVTVVLTYIGIELSNIYRTMLENQVFFNMMIPFKVYNKMILNFPFVTAIVGIASMLLGVVNYQKARVNTSKSDLDF